MGSLLLALFAAAAVAQDPTPTSASSPSSTSAGAAPSIVQDTATYSYLGCYNETTGNPSVGSVRALDGGNMTASDTMTVQQCLAFCGGQKYAGLEYGRECWCAATLNVYATKVSEDNCSLTCTGDKTELCGGSLKLTTYQRKTDAQSSAHRCTTASSGIIFVASLVGYYVTR